MTAGAARRRALTAVVLSWSVCVGACSEDESVSGDAGTLDAGSGGSSGGGGLGGTAGTAGADGGCAQPPGSCDTCQDNAHAGCSCSQQVSACNADPDCVAITECALLGSDDGGPGPCLDFSDASAACVLACADQFPAAKQKYLALENCFYCQYCRSDCSAGDYCDSLSSLAEAGVDAGSDAADATADSEAEAASDAATDSVVEAGSDAALDSAADSAGD